MTTHFFNLQSPRIATPARLTALLALAALLSACGGGSSQVVAFKPERLVVLEQLLANLIGFYFGLAGDLCHFCRTGGGLGTARCHAAKVLATVLRQLFRVRLAMLH